MSIVIIYSIFIFLFGLIIGSFLNCVIYRLEKNQSFVKGRSYCPHCKHTLTWLDLVPVFSFLFLGGKCRYCHKKISVQYPLVELLTGLLFVAIFYIQFPFFVVNASNLINLAFLLYIASVLITILVFDLKFYLIPDNVLFPAVAIALVYRLYYFSSFLPFALAALGAAGFFLLIFLVTRGKGMGFGDVKLAILLGLLLGWPNILVGLFLSFFFGAIIGVSLMLLHKKKLKSEVPFAPFLIVATFVALFFGEQIIQWYTHFLIF